MPNKTGPDPPPSGFIFYELANVGYQKISCYTNWYNKTQYTYTKRMCNECGSMFWKGCMGSEENTAVLKNMDSKEEDSSWPTRKKCENDVYVRG